VSVNGTTKVESVTFRRTSAAGGSDEVLVTVPAGAVVRAIGFRGGPVPGLPFDVDRGVIPNSEGRVLADSEPMVGVYCAGWIKRGATGVIGTNKFDAQATVAALLADHASGTLAAPAGDAATFEAAVRIQCPAVLPWADAAEIDRAERRAGQASGRPRVKLVEIKQMLETAEKDILDD
jgi:ferredoxin--NADP+ reductase